MSLRPWTNSPPAAPTTPKCRKNGVPSWPGGSDCTWSKDATVSNCRVSRSNRAMWPGFHGALKPRPEDTPDDMRTWPAGSRPWACRSAPSPGLGALTVRTSDPSANNVSLRLPRSSTRRVPELPAYRKEAQPTSPGPSPALAMTSCRVPSWLSTTISRLPQSLTAALPPREQHTAHPGINVGKQVVAGAGSVGVDRLAGERERGRRRGSRVFDDANADAVADVDVGTACGAGCVAASAEG